MSIEIINLNKNFDQRPALQNINLTINSGSLVALLGPSGCGKTTLLRIIAGLEVADSGQIIVDGIDIAALSVQQRKFGFMFQNYALFRQMSVFDNIAFGLKVLPRQSRPTKQQIQNKVGELLHLIQLEWTANAYPDQLSGGQKQRVALARALAVSPKLLLLDEPFGALDAKVRKELRQWLSQIQKELGITTVLVTHDQDEAIEIADKLIVMNYGKIEQNGSPEQLYFNPKNAYITEFLGEVNSFENAVIKNGRLWINNFCYLIDRKYHHITERVFAYIRPHEFKVSKLPIANSLGSAKVISIFTTGNYVKLILKMENNQQIITVLSHHEFQAMAIQSNEILYLQPREITFFLEQELIDYAI